MGSCPLQKAPGQGACTMNATYSMLGDNLK